MLVYDKHTSSLYATKVHTVVLMFMQNTVHDSVYNIAPTLRALRFCRHMVARALQMMTRRSGRFSKAVPMPLAYPLQTTHTHTLMPVCERASWAVRLYYPTAHEITANMCSLFFPFVSENKQRTSKPKSLCLVRVMLQAQICH